MSIPAYIKTVTGAVCDPTRNKGMDAILDEIDATDAQKANKADLDAQNTMSTEEHWTGEYYLDGRKIYEKTIVVDKTGGTNSLQVLHGISSIGDFRSIAFDKTTLAPLFDDEYIMPQMTSVTSSMADYSFFIYSFNSTKLTCAVRGSSSYIGKYKLVLTVRYTCTDR